MEITKTVLKRVYRTERHIRWNREPSPDHPNMMRYHFVVVDDKYRDMTMNLLEEIISVSIEKIRTDEGDAPGTRMKYLFRSYDSELSVESFPRINKPMKRDTNLKERLRGDITNYVRDTYSP